jgi:hypothetical protein
LVAHFALFPNAQSQLKNAKELPSHRTDRITNDKNGQLVTKAKIKRAESVNLKCKATNKLYRKLTVKSSEMPASF